MYRIETSFRGQIYYWYGNFVKWKLSQNKAVIYDNMRRAELELERIKERQDWSGYNAQIVKVV